MRAWRSVILFANVAGMLWGACAPAGAQPGVDPAPDKNTPDGYAWQSENPYRPPDFASYFPDSPEGAAALASWWAEKGARRAGTPDDLAVVRQGLRRYAGPRMPILRWVGNNFIWGETPQHPDAIALMYHAAECREANADPHGTRGPATYFGLSVVRPKTDAILRALVDICMRVDDPNDLSRVAWGLGGQRADALEHLERYKKSAKPEVREKALVVEQIFNRELRAFAWAEARARDRARYIYGGHMNFLLAALRGGTSADRRMALQVIAEQGLAGIMDDSSLNDFRGCAMDDDAGVRAETARIVGSHWIWKAESPAPEAMDILMLLSEDPDREVRYNAVYFGLSTIPHKDAAVIRRLLTIAFEDREPNMYRRIAWGLRRDRALTRELLEHYESDPKWGDAAREFRADMFGPDE